MPRLTPEELAVAGHAVALSQWHQVHLAACCALVSAEWLPAHIPQCLSCCLHRCHLGAAFRCPHSTAVGWDACMQKSHNHRLAATLCIPGLLTLMLSPCMLLQSHGFCGRCGAPTEPIEAGAKRQCTRENKHREYPRTDPVVSGTQDGAVTPVCRCCAAPSCWRDHLTHAFAGSLAVFFSWKKCVLCLSCANITTLKPD